MFHDERQSSRERLRIIEPNRKVLYHFTIFATVIEKLNNKHQGELAGILYIEDGRI